jgi:hypothetical protein
MTDGTPTPVAGGLSIRIVIVAVSFFVAVVGIDPAQAQPSYQHVKDSGPTPVYWDAGSIKRDEDAFEVEVLEVFVTGVGRPLNGTITRQKLSCTWGASLGGTLGMRTIDQTGKVLDRSGPAPFVQGSFYGPHGWMAAVVPIVCDPASKYANGLTVAQAMADAKVRLAAKPVARPDPVPAAAPPAASAAARFAPVRVDRKMGNMSFVDWSRISRQQDKVTVQVFDALGDNTPPPPEPQWRYSVFALRTIEADCKARTLAQTGYVTFDKYLEAEFPDATPWPLRTASDWPLGADILKAVCSGEEPSSTLASRAAAIAHQRSLHPLSR